MSRESILDRLKRRVGKLFARPPVRARKRVRRTDLAALRRLERIMRERKKKFARKRAGGERRRAQNMRRGRVPPRRLPYRLQVVPMRAANGADRRRPNPGGTKLRKKTIAARR